MKGFVGYCIPVALIGFCLTMVLGLMFGESGWAIAGFLAVGALIAIGICVYQKLEDVEKKLDALLEKREKTTSEE